MERKGWRSYLLVSVKKDFLFPQRFFCCAHLLYAWCCVRIMALDNVIYSKETVWLMITLFQKISHPHNESKQTIKCSQTRCTYYAYNHVRSMFSQMSHRHKKKGEAVTTFAVRLLIVGNVDGYFKENCHIIHVIAHAMYVTR